MLEENDLQKLLRLKRHEQPPPAYFEDFLREFQQRQRDEMLRQPAWQVAWDRLGAFIGRVSLPRLAYHAATAAIVLTAGTVSWKILESDSALPGLAQPGSGSEVTQAAKNPALAATTPTRRNASALVLEDKFFSDVWEGAQRQVADTGRRTHYVMDAHPVSYEPASSF